MGLAGGMNENLFWLLRYAFQRNPSGVALQVPGEGSISYAELEAESAAYAGRLEALGVSAGDRVLVQVDKSPQAVCLYLACLRAGAVFVPVNTAYTAQEVAYFLADAEPVLFVCRPSDEAGFSETSAGVAVRSLGADGAGSLPQTNAAANSDVAVRTADDLAAILYTSGTTGRSKGAMLSHGNLATSAVILIDCWGWRDDDVLLHALPVFHVHGLFVALHCAMLTATPMIFLPGFDADAVMAQIPAATIMMGVPTFYTRLLAHPELTAQHCRDMRLFISGSAPLTDQTFEAFESRTGHRILERYGMSETMMNTSNPLDGERVAGTVGFPLPGVALRIASAEGELLPRGEVGVIEVKGPNVFGGYWRMPDKTREEFRSDGFFITGDLATQDERGRVTIVGRAKDLVISGGYNVYPKEVESVLDEMPEVRESAVIGVPHPDFGEAVIAVVVPSGEPVTLASVDAALAGRLARFKQPKRVVNVEQLPRNAMGKVQKNALRKDCEDLFSPSRDTAS